MEMEAIGGERVQLNEAVFDRPFSEALVHQVVTAYQAAGRAGTKAQKSRSDVNGTTKKFKKQKGGGARHGDYRAPIFVGGGVTFAARPRSFAQKVNRKMYRGALQAIFSELRRQGRLKLVSDFNVSTAKTKAFLEQLHGLGLDRALIIRDEISESLYLAARNVPHVQVVDVEGIDPVSLVGADHVVLTVSAAKKIEEWLA